MSEPQPTEPTQPKGRPLAVALVALVLLGGLGALLIWRPGETGAPPPTARASPAAPASPSRSPAPAAPRGSPDFSDWINRSAASPTPAGTPTPAPSVTSSPFGLPPRPAPSTAVPGEVLKPPWPLLLSARDALGKTEDLDDVPAEIRALDGKTIRITGYLGMPYLTTGEIELVFLQENPFNGCCIGQDPNFWDSIETRYRDGRMIQLPPDFEYHYRDFQLKVTAQGTFRVHKLNDEGAVEQLYFIDADEIVIADHVEDDQLATERAAGNLPPTGSAGHVRRKEP